MKKATIFAAILGLMALTLCFSCMAQETTPIGTITGPVSSTLTLTILEIRNYNTDEIKNLYERPEYLYATDAILKAIEKYITQGTDRQRSCERIKIEATNNAFQNSIYRKAKSN